MHGANVAQRLLQCVRASTENWSWRSVTPSGHHEDQAERGRYPSTRAGPLYSWNPATSTSGKKNKTLRHENKNQGPRDPGNGTLETAFRIIKLHRAAEVFFQRKPKIENRQKSEGPPQWFNSSLFGGECSVVGPSLGVPGRRPEDSFPLPVKLF